ncbi:PPK2 family polyphosphate kinase [Desertimonas flava]|uniref:PPK2 family polyphosphate kinase n=1 Tax=Desertimonas flava TaxID=2064846 RepID=UPI001D0BFDD3|nr:PPK2 family polyphosphate kinase [Desertimonas flava]
MTSDTEIDPDETTADTEPTGSAPEDLDLGGVVARSRAGSSFSLDDHDPRDTFGWDKEAAKARVLSEIAVVAELQKLLFAERKQALLVVLQAMDAAGKDGVLRTVLTGLNPAGVHVTSFGVPSEEELAHDFLWRVHRQTPAKGQIGVFNRSHYEDVLVVRVKGLAPAKVWKKRYDHIAAFERTLVDDGTAVVKLYLNVSNEKQRERLQDRVDSPDERWKFRRGDLEDRKLWPDYMAAYTEAIRRTDADHAPWYVVPADRKWVRNLVVARILRHELEQLDPKFPPPEPGIAGTIVE